MNKYNALWICSTIEPQMSSATGLVYLFLENVGTVMDLPIAGKTWLGISYRECKSHESNARVDTSLESSEAYKDRRLLVFFPSP